MAESAKLNLDCGKVEDDNVGEGVEEEGFGRSSAVLAGLNLAVILSSLSISDEECQNLEDRIEKRKISNGRHRAGGATGESINNKTNIRTRSRSRRREVNEIRAAGRQTANTTTKIRDCRHGRKM
ncbi:uncharacterized protein LOC127252461 [Andrographis paniculata]|uniref:uncharacterized protein LOC127252461 n=1 Tax=Andrographis paniculata TaxID=175694 RepID=UPI0021E849F6|nr:uncharacterized protein LOC127252461 [Andrographis paniculata]